MTAPLDVVLDVDTGVDDALAVMVAVRSPRLRLRGVTCVAGNVGVDQVTTNTATVLAVLGRTDIPLGRGCGQAALPGPSVHGPDGLAGLAGPPHVPEHDAQQLLGRAGEVTLLTCGPLTTVAWLAAHRPGALAGITRLVTVGGAPGQANHRMDPEAADRIPPELPRTDVGPGTTAAGVAGSTLDRLAASPGRAARFAAALLAHQLARGAGLGDAAAVLALAGYRAPYDGVVLELLTDLRSAPSRQPPAGRSGRRAWPGPPRRR